MENAFNHVIAKSKTMLYCEFISTLSKQYCYCSVTKSCPTLFCNCMECSPPGSSVHRISQEEYCNALPFPSLGNLPSPGIEPVSL